MIPSKLLGVFLCEFEISASFLTSDVCDDERCINLINKV